MTDRPPFVAVVLAAGQGTRMKSKQPKVLHPVVGRPMVCWPTQAALDAGASRAVVVVGYGAEDVTKALHMRFGDRVSTAIQAEQRGTGDAVRSALPSLEGYEGHVIILYGDCPLVRVETIARVTRAVAAAKCSLGLITSRLADPTGYGRILRDDNGSVCGIREHKDCSPEERQINEVNPGLYVIDAAFLRKAIGALEADNAQGELYLTDVVATAAREGSVTDIQADIEELRGVNDRHELALVEARMRARLLEDLARSGVTLRDPAHTYVEADVTVEPDVVIEAGVHLRGKTRVGAGAHIDVGSVLTNTTMAPGAVLKPYTVATDSTIGEAATTGPFAHLRPGADLGPEVRVGNFVEVKKTRMGRGSKANHLAYLGDGEVGEGSNIGAGVIFCNYDGVQKNKTVIGDGSFVGSDCQLIAPVRVGDGAYVASGTTVSLDVPDDALAVGRARQENKEGYATRLRKRLEARKDK